MSVYVGQKIEFSHRGLDFVAIVGYDDCAEKPWDRECGHVPVFEVSHDYGTNYGNAKKPGDYVFHRGDRREYSYCVNIPDALALARSDKWGIDAAERKAFTEKHGRPPTTREIARMAVDADIKILERFAAGHWEYVGVTVTLASEPEGESHSLWGIESFGDYLESEVCPELAEELIRPRVLAWRDALRCARENRKLSRLASVMAGAMS
jgi:hypothetical protein